MIVMHPVGHRECPYEMNCPYEPNRRLKTGPSSNVIAKFIGRFKMNVAKQIKPSASAAFARNYYERVIGTKMNAYEYAICFGTQ
jgi:hypothetical protein